MLVCWEWLSQYVDLSSQDPRQLANQFAMSGLNHESTAQVGSDTVIDLEVTSNRGDCLGHIGVAREAAALLGKPLCIPKPTPEFGSRSSTEFIHIDNQFAEACPRYTARVIRGVKIGPSPEWLVRRLAAVGINSINNVVDATNYVMLECGQPLHAFDLQAIRGGQILIRPAKAGEKFLAIDHRTYELDPQMVVIADAQRAVALGGVMGGADSEVALSTSDLLIEAARFSPLAVRHAARKLKLHSPSSFRFERCPDPAGLEWASLRCCQLILDMAGGELCRGEAASGSTPPPPASIALRLTQVPKILGIDIPADQASRILTALGCQVSPIRDGELQVTPPSWRADLYREIDLVEEVARLHGYEQIPENVSVPLGVATPRPKDIMLTRARHVLSAYGIDEAMTPSVVAESLERCGSVWSEQPALATETPLLVGARLLRRSLLPSLLAARHTNQAQAIRHAQLYEVANIYLPAAVAADLPGEQSTLGLVANADLRAIKGIVEEILRQVAGKQPLVEWNIAEHPMFEAGTAQRLTRGQHTLGWLGLVHPAILETMQLDQACAVAELNVDMLTEMLVEVRRADAVSPFPAINRDLNFVVDERLRWQQLSDLCTQQGGDELQDVSYRETYRDTNKDGAGRKRILLTLQFQSLARTLTGEEVDARVSAIVAACESQFQAHLLA